jgi:hypothetical protein
VTLERIRRLFPVAGITRMARARQQLQLLETLYQDGHES